MQFPGKGPPRKGRRTSKAELRSARNRRVAIREGKEATASKSTPFRELVTMNDGQGRSIYDRSIDASSFDSNLNYIGLSLIGRGTLASLWSRYKEEEAKSRLEAVCAILPDSLTVTLEGIELFGARTEDIGNRYVAFSLSPASNNVLRDGDRAAISSEFGLPFEHYAGHISFRCTLDEEQALIFRDEARDLLSLPATALLGQAALRPSKALYVTTS